MYLGRLASCHGHALSTHLLGGLERRLLRESRLERLVVRIWFVGAQRGRGGKARVAVVVATAVRVGAVLVRRALGAVVVIVVVIFVSRSVYLKMRIYCWMAK